jgi:hypothetical protein
VGVEPHPTIARTDLRTFVCTSCDDLQTENVPLKPSARHSAACKSATRKSEVSSRAN